VDIGVSTASMVSSLLPKPLPAILTDSLARQLQISGFVDRLPQPIAGVHRSSSSGQHAGICVA
jgi:hypothetical protein